jgi:hypothetical protein
VFGSVRSVRLEQVYVVNEGVALVCGSGAGFLESIKRQMGAAPTISSRLATLNLREVFWRPAIDAITMAPRATSDKFGIPV